MKAKAKAKCSTAYHEGINQDNTSNYSNISAMSVRTQGEHRTRDVMNKAKRQRRDKASHWIASKSNNMIDNVGSSRRETQRGSK